MSLINIGKRIGDMDIRLGIPPSKPQFSVTETNKRFSHNNVSSNYNSVFNEFRSGLTQGGGLARPTQFLCTIDGPQSKALPRDYVYADPTGSKKSAARLKKSARLAGAIKDNLQLRMDLFLSLIHI